jgi:perosamine synthetase
MPGSPAPLPRFRLYTRSNSYLSMLQDLLADRVNRGGDVEAFEEKLRLRFGVSHAVCTSMARVGIYLAFRATIEPGRKVILSPYTIADVVNMLLAAGGVPVFADIERRTCNLDPAGVEKLIDSETAAVLVTHLHGLAAPAARLRKICDTRGIVLVEDAAQAFGARENGVPVGAIGHAGIVSFGMYKNINAWYGGAVLTNDSTIAQKVQGIRAGWGYQSPAILLKRMAKGLASDIATFPPLFKLLTYRIFRYGFLNDIEWINRRVQTELDVRRRDSIPAHYLARMTPFQARLALPQLDRIDRETDARIERARAYHAALDGTGGLLLPPPPRDRSHIYTYYPVQCEDRQGLLRWLMQNNRDAAAQHLKNCADLPGFSAFYRDCPNARETAAQVVLLPTYPRYSMADVQRTAEAVRSFFKNNPERG